MQADGNDLFSDELAAFIQKTGFNGVAVTAAPAGTEVREPCLPVLCPVSAPVKFFLEENGIFRAR
jgi:hypothetical protein